MSSPRRQRIALLAGLAVLLGLLALNLSTRSWPGMQEDHPIIAFARDFSGNDQSLVAKVRAWLDQPPTAPDQIGFHSAEGYNPTSRLFLATVNLLDEAGHLSSVEDKYTYELLQIWNDDKVVDAASLPEPAKTVFAPFLTGTSPHRSAEEVAAYRAMVWESYARATEQLEEHIAARGKVLLSIDATEGDTMFFARVDKDIAARWRDKALSEQDGYRAGVRAPMWDRFWNHLAYAARGFIAEDTRTGYPRGTRRRANDIPFAH